MNAKQHLMIGGLAGAGFCLLNHSLRTREDPDIEFDWVELATYVGIGMACASLPDWLEPATSPNHRAFFHSLTAAGLVSFGAFGPHSEEMDPKAQVAIKAVAVSYLTHLAADFTTPKCLPLIHPKLL